MGRVYLRTLFQLNMYNLSLSPTLFKIYIQSDLENWQKKCSKMRLEIQDTTIYSLLFADDQLLIAQDEDLEYMTRKLTDEYELWGLKLNVKKKTYTWP